MYYFASDIHLGLQIGSDPENRERLLVQWLDEVSKDADAIFLVGDIFDFWYEYRYVVPKGFTRLLGKLSELTDRGIPVHFFGGNHDIWTYRYLHDECGVTLYHSPYTEFELDGRKVIVGHGDMLGPRPAGQRILSAIFRSRLLQWLFSMLHPYWAMMLGKGWSRSNRTSRPVAHIFRGEEEPIIGFAHEYQRTHPSAPADLFSCGHTHCAEVYPLPEGGAVAFLGEWIDNPLYGVLGPGGFELKGYPDRAVIGKSGTTRQ